MTPGEWGLLLALSLLWGGSFFFVAVALSELPPFTLVLLRVSLAAAALHIVLRLAGLRLPGDRETLVALAGMSVLNNVIPFSLIVWGQTQVASGLASILNAATPLFTVVIAHVWTADERMTGGRAGGVLIGLAGVAAMVGVDALRAAGGSLAGQLACLGAALSYAIAGVYGRRFRAMGVPPLVTATGQVTVSSLLLLPVAMAVDAPWTLPLPSATVMAALLGLGLLSTALAYLLFFRLLASAGATNIALVTFLIPVMAIALGVAVLGERLEPRHLLGMAMIGLGLAAIDGRPLRAVARRLGRAAP
ncbi:DMT family transporter [Azospirillum sp. RWY-5-1]|uniref:DMT family transporter n=2 Tax=Azospirillum oleiclasticum TaxID=2735135 RepID=A0ABX2TEW9_9PROT|nr:DMT family transporter [Azospirillum oleiclasticum]NYZ22890.1 DMT family transporter [Azospirillum oleiclasticum]